jgi:RNA polymerase sigma-70 factor (sigma-E family)
LEPSDFSSFAATAAAQLKRSAYLLTGDRQLAEDLVQSTLLRMYERWGRSSTWDNPIAYSRATMYSIFVSWHRRLRVTEILASELPDLPVPSHEPAVDRALLLQAMAALPRRQRAAVVLKYYEDLDHDEISRVLSCSATTVRTQLSRAMKKLRSDPQLTGILEAGRR